MVIRKWENIIVFGFIEGFVWFICLNELVIINILFFVSCLIRGVEELIWCLVIIWSCFFVNGKIIWFWRFKF